MKATPFSPPAPVLAGALALALALPLPPRAAAQPLEDLTLRVNDASAIPGGIAAVVLRTYSSRSIGQGQICLRSPARAPQAAAGAPAPAAGEPFAALLGAYVFSRRLDARNRALFSDGAVQQLDVRFASPTESINEVDGPLAVMYFRLATSVRPGDEYDLVLDPAGTGVIGADGRSIPLRLRSGRLTVRAPAEPYEASASAEETVPGQLAFLGFTTIEPVRLSGGQVGLWYDPAIAAGPVEVFIDPRYGRATWTVDDSVPGRVLVSFQSPDGSLNRLPGEIVSVRVPTRADIPPGSESPVRVDRELTVLFDRQGAPLPLAFEDDVLVFTP